MSGILTPSQFVGVTSANAARIFNIYPKKGRIEVGSDADIVVWDGAAERTISATTHHHKVDFNIFEGMKVHGVADYTISGGVVVWELGELHLSDRRGKYVDRPCFGPVFDSIANRDCARDERLRKVEREPYSGPVVQI